MSSLEFNKIAGAVLTAGVIAMFAGFIAELLVHPDELEENVYVVAGDGGGAAPAETEEPGLEPILPLLAAADPAAGEKVAKKCTACHTFEEGGADKIGPHLWGVVNREIASVAGFGYSSALQEKAGQPWDYESLNGFLAKPKDWAPGTKMSFAGLKKVDDRAAIVAYMRTMSADPAPLPTDEEISALQQASSEETAAEESAAEPAAAESGAVAEAEDGSALGTLIAAADMDAGKKVSKKCTACHTFEQGAANKLGPNLYNVLGRQVAGADGYKYSKALSGMSGEVWSYENLSAYLENPKDWAPGNKMSFAGLKKPEDRAAILAFLRDHSDNPPPLPE